jgi:hypothetical protein
MEVLKELMFVLCHLFERSYLHPSARAIDFAELGPSKVRLPHLTTAPCRERDLTRNVWPLCRL